MSKKSWLTKNKRTKIFQCFIDQFCQSTLQFIFILIAIQFWWFRLTTNNMKLVKLTTKMSTEIGQQQNNMKRFYKEATVTHNQHKKHPLHQHLLLLDGKTVKTPYRNPLAFPSLPLAFLVVNQFNRQHKYLKTGQMPLLALSRTAVDADIEGHIAEHLRHSIFQYLKTDTLLFENDCYEEEYSKLSSPLIDFFKKRFQIKMQASNSIQAPTVQINSNFVNWVEGLTNWQLIGLETMTIWMRSTIAAVAMAESQFDPQQIQTAAYLQEMTQMKGSGEVQQKLMDFNQIKLMVSSGQIMYRYGQADPS